MTIEMAKPIFLAVLAATSLLSGEAAMAQGHIAGGAVGAVAAGKHHRVAGAVIGGAVGHHMAKAKAAKKAGTPPK